MQTQPEHPHSKHEKAMTLAGSGLALLALMLLANMTPDMLAHLLP